MNSSLRVTTRTGGSAQTATLSSIFGTPSGGTTLFDPWVVYDHFSGRFVVICLTVNSAKTDGWYILAASKTSTASTAASNWWVYYLRNDINYPSTDTAFWGDYEKLGFDNTFFTAYLQVEPGKYRATPLLAPTCKIEHPSPHGDPWTYTHLADLNGDGRHDLLYGTHQGHVWLHAAGDSAGQYDETGKQLRLASGDPIHVGPAPGQDVKDFTILQGSRTTLTTGDFDGDGRTDLVVGDTDGVARYFRNIGTTTEPVFELAHEFVSLGIRMVPCAADWNGDGRMDVIGSAANGKVVVWINRGEGIFDSAEPIGFPPVPYSPTVSVVDWNEDGDEDLIVTTAYGFFCWFERSFLERGAMQAGRVP